MPFEGIEFDTLELPQDGDEAIPISTLIELDEPECMMQQTFVKRCLLSLYKSMHSILTKVLTVCLLVSLYKTTYTEISTTRPSQHDHPSFPTRPEESLLFSQMSPEFVHLYPSSDDPAAA